MSYKNPESILVVIYCSMTKRFLMLQRNDDPTFWQSITGSLEIKESPYQAALREIAEEIGLTHITTTYPLIDLEKSIEFEIFPQFRHRYAPNITINLEHWFSLILPYEYHPILTEHSSYQWVNKEIAMSLTPSNNNAEAIEYISLLYQNKLSFNHAIN